MEQVLVNGAVLSANYALIALGITLIFSIMSILNFAHGQMFMIGAFMVYYVYGVWKLPYALGLVAAVVPDSPAAKGGLQAGDIILKVDGKEVNTVSDLRAAVAAHYNTHHGLDLDWQREVTITSGATEAIAAALLAFIEPGDEVVLFEPLYDAYLPMVKRAGGVPRVVRLQPPHWRFDRETVTAAFSARTRVVVINTPLNPTASVMSRDELAMLAELCVAHSAIVVSDGVPFTAAIDANQLVSDGLHHRP